MAKQEVELSLPTITAILRSQYFLISPSGLRGKCGRAKDRQSTISRRFPNSHRLLETPPFFNMCARSIEEAYIRENLIFRPIRSAKIKPALSTHLPKPILGALASEAAFYKIANENIIFS